MDSLKTSFDFRKIYAKGLRFNTKHLTLFVKEENYSKGLKLGIVIKKKIGNAVNRNRLRRILKESFRSLEQNTKKSLKILVVFKKIENLKPFELKSYDIQSEIKTSIKRWIM